MKTVTQFLLATQALMVAAALQAAEPFRSVRIVLFVPDGSTVPADYETKLQSVAAFTEHFLASEIRRWGWTIDRETIFSRTLEDTVEVLLARGTIPAGQTGRDALPSIRQTASSFVTNRYGASATANDVLWIFYHTPDHDVQGFQGSGTSTGGLAINAYPAAEATITLGADLASPAMRELQLKGTIHELGHGLGLPHIGPKPSLAAGNTLMGPTNNAYESQRPADTRVYLSEASAAMLANHPLFSNAASNEEIPPFSISVTQLIFTEGLEGQFTVSGNIFSEGAAHSAVILDTSSDSSGYWSRPYRSGVAEWGKFSLTIDDPFDQTTGTLSLFFAHEDGHNSATGQREVLRGDTLEISYSGLPGNRTFTPIDWSQSTSPFNAILMGGDTSFSIDGTEVMLGVEQITNHRSTDSASNPLALQLWATETNFSSGPLSGHKIAEQTITPVNGGSTASEILQNTSLITAPAGNYNLVLVLAEWNGTSYDPVDHINLSPRHTFAETVPGITVHPRNTTAAAGRTASLTVIATGSPTPTFQWFREGVPITGETLSTLTIESAENTDTGAYRVEATNVQGTATSNPATLTVYPADTRSKLSNLSVRTSLTSSQNLVVGAVVDGGAKSILMRAGGPALDQYGLAGMPDPQLELFDSNQTSLGANDDWDVSLTNSFNSVGAYAFSNGSKDAALVQDLAGPFTVRVGGTGGGGTVLVEAYDLSGGSTPRLVNLSARNKVGTGSDILIAGFVIEGLVPMKVLIRVVGPTLTDYGIADPLADPRLAVFDSENGIILENDDWSSSLTSSFTSTGAFLLPVGSKDAAIVVEIPPGTYTVQASGIDGEEGEAIIEVYELE